MTLCWSLDQNLLEWVNATDKETVWNNPQCLVGLYRSLQRSISLLLKTIFIILLLQIYHYLFLLPLCIMRPQ